MAIEADGLVKRFGAATALDDVTLALAAGERLALLGHNGAGKTTLMKLLLGLLRPEAGSVRVLGHDPAALPAELRRSIGFLPESVVFPATMTGWEVLRFYARLKRRPAKECRLLLDQVGLGEAARRRVGTWSKGMRQRLGLAQALLGTPRLLLLDEPTSGLDPELRQSFYGVVADLARGGTAVLLSSHLLTELEERTDRIAVLDRGRLVACGDLEALRTQAGLPLRLVVTAAPGRAAELRERLPGLAEQPDGSLVLACEPADKLAALARVMELRSLLLDIEVMAPGLDAVYARLTGAAAEREV